jgi:hypothetical protein
MLWDLSGNPTYLALVISSENQAQANPTLKYHLELFPFLLECSPLFSHILHSKAGLYPSD